MLLSAFSQLLPPFVAVIDMRAFSAVFLATAAFTTSPTTNGLSSAKQLLPQKMDPQRIIIDTDMSTDCDDVGAVCMAHALMDLGEANLLAVVHNTGLPEGVGAVSAINAWYGREETVPVGAYKGPFDSDWPSKYVHDVVEHSTATVKNYSQVCFGFEAIAVVAVRASKVSLPIHAKPRCIMMYVADGRSVCINRCLLQLKFTDEPWPARLTRLLSSAALASLGIWMPCCSPKPTTFPRSAGEILSRPKCSGSCGWVVDTRLRPLRACVSHVHQSRVFHFCGTAPCV